MRQLSSTALLGVWEEAALASPAERALLLVRTAHPEWPRAEILQQSIAERDAALLEMREALFGAELRALAPCPRCDGDTELLFRTEQIRPAGRTVSGEPIVFGAGPYSGTFRLPIGADWLALPSGGADRNAVRDSLVKRCLLTLIGEDGENVTGAPPAEVLAAVGVEIAQRDSDAHTELELACPACGHAWSVIFDVTSYLWREIDAYCRRLLQQVHRLARVYGWTESEILRLSAARRESYLALVENG